MDALYHGPVFNEWVVISLIKSRASVLHYEGPRADTFSRQLQSDAASLAAAMEGHQYAVGDFEFVQDASGSSFDAMIRLGDATYLLCNNTERSMADLRASIAWRESQKPFLALTQKFLASPLESGA